MESAAAIDALGALAHGTRLGVFRLLVRMGSGGMAAGAIAQVLAVPNPTLSAHLATLERAGLISARREGRFIHYSANLDGLRDLVRYLLEDCCAGEPALCGQIADIAQAGLQKSINSRPEEVAMDRPYNILFLCTGNSARSVIAEAIMNRAGQGRFIAHSAGSQPKGQVHPRTIELLKKLNYDTAAFRSKSWEEFAAPGAPELDFVFTVCDSAAAEACPVWPGQPMTAHWGVPDPAAATGTDAQIALAFAEAYRMLDNRIQIFVNLPLASLDKLTLQKRLDAIGKSASSPAAA